MAHPPSPERIPTPYPPPPSTRPKPSTPGYRRPNVILFLTDDQDLQLGSLDVMNQTKELFAQGGTQMRKFYVTIPICCPSRISLLSGRYAHNTGAITTSKAGWCAVGEYWKAPMQNQSLPTYVRRAGYATGIFGKEVNVNDDTYISPGWDRFFVLGGRSEGHFYANWFNDQGRRYTAKPDEYMTDLIQNRSLSWISEQIRLERPFFAYIAPHAPHTRATPAPDTDGYFWDWQAPRLPNWNASASDKHWMVRTQPPMSDHCADSSDALYRSRLRSLLGVDALVGAVAKLLSDAGQLDNTYMLYTSDHGFHLGQFRMPMFKVQPYETDINVPFLARGPGIAAGRTIEKAIGLNIDIAPTIAELVGTLPPPAAKVDGRSLAPLLFNETEQASPWRKDFLFEYWGDANNVPREYLCNHIMNAPNNTYAGIGTEEGLKYVEFQEASTKDTSMNFTEMYNLTSDPYEMTNLIMSEPVPSKQTQQLLKDRLSHLQACSEESCRSDGPRIDIAVV